MPKSKVRKKNAVHAPDRCRQQPDAGEGQGPDPPGLRRGDARADAGRPGLAELKGRWLGLRRLDPVHDRARLVELPDRLRADRGRAADDDAVALAPVEPRVRPRLWTTPVDSRG